MPMKKKSKAENITYGYVCDTCELEFDGKPYASIDTPAGFKVSVCSEPCYRVCLSEQQKMLTGFEDFIEDDLMDFVEALAERADYEFVWESIKKYIRTFRCQMIENYYGQLEQNEVKTSSANAKNEN